MCVAILQKAGKSITPAMLYEGWRINSDGGGFAYIGDDKKVHIDTGYMKYNDFEKSYRNAVEKFGDNGPMLIHMRIKSAGSIHKKNCHPFPIKGGAMIHNGTMFYPNNNWKDPLAKQKSDTRIFAESFYNILDLESAKLAEEDILRAVGSYNKLVFLYDGGDYHIMNEKAGVWDNDIWYSNRSCYLSANSYRR